MGLRGGRDGASNMLGLTLEIPLFVRNDFSAEVTAAALDMSQQQQLYQETYRRALAKLDGANQRFQNTRQTWKNWLKQGQKAQQTQEKLLNKLWQAGELTASDYLIQAKQNVDTAMTATQLQAELLQALISLLAASGQIEQWAGLDSNKEAVQ